MNKPEQARAKDILVRIGEWREGQGDERLITHDLGPCIGVAIYEPVSKKGFLLHEPNPEDDGTYARFEDRLRNAFIDQPGSFGGMKVWLSGGSGLLANAISSSGEQLVAENRQFVQEAMSDLGIPAESVQVAWTPDDYLSADMELDCSSGSCQITYR